MSGTVFIKSGRAKPILQQHPWIFSGAIERVEGSPAPGEIVTVKDSGSNFLARGYWNPRSQIQVRLLTWADEAIDEAWWRRMLRRAFDARPIRTASYMRGDAGKPAFRLVNAENDFLPGLIVDVYDRWLVLQALTLGIDQRKPLLVKLLAEIMHPMGIYERSDIDVRGKEGLTASSGMLWGVEAPPRITIAESYGKPQMLVDIRQGHKTGLYLDQSENRALVGELLSTRISGPARLLNVFSYTGGFGLHALLNGGAHVVNVDSSHEALELAEENARLNGLTGEHGESAEYIQADAFVYLRDMASAGEQYEIIVLDPPKFASSAQQVEKAARGYKDINLHALKCVRSGGYLLTFSCSGAVSRDLFQKIVFGALADSGRQAQIVRHLGAADDHPVALTFPEGEYLKGLLLRVW
ncbi:MAG: class I SAM-dependent rRNA methyltransferase [Chloroflexi bacterium]|nr:class I SAM-dependent rRNA methyltransferase [Chloroflexota bacterium]